MGRPAGTFRHRLFWTILLILAAGAPRLALAQTLDHYTLLMAWLPGQCLVNPDLPLCPALTLKDEAGRNLTLIGLRPDPRANSVPMRDCDPMTEAFSTPLLTGEVETPATRDCHLPEMRLSEELAKALAGVMPTTAQCAERRFWASYGSCSLLSQERYFRRAVDRAVEMRHTLLNFAIAGAIGNRVKRDSLLESFTQQFGEESADSLLLICGRSKEHRLPVLTEIRVSLRQQGTMRPLSAEGMWQESGSALLQQCPEEFLVAEAGQPAPDPVARPLPPGTVTIPQMPDIPAPRVPDITRPQPPADPTKPQPMQTEPMEITPPLP